MEVDLELFARLPDDVGRNIWLRYTSDRLYRSRVRLGLALVSIDTVKFDQKIDLGSIIRFIHGAVMVKWLVHRGLIRHVAYRWSNGRVDPSRRILLRILLSAGCHVSFVDSIYHWTWKASDLRMADVTTVNPKVYDQLFDVVQTSDNDIYVTNLVQEITSDILFACDSVVVLDLPMRLLLLDLHLFKEVTDLMKIY